MSNVPSYFLRGGLLAISALLGACSSGAGSMTPPVQTAAVTAPVRAEETAASVEIKCLSPFACTQVTLLAPLRGASNGLGELMISAALTTVPAAWSVPAQRNYVLAPLTVKISKTCLSRCAVVMTTQPYSLGVAPAIEIQGPIVQKGTEIVLKSMQVPSVPAGRYYFYLAEI